MNRLTKSDLLKENIDMYTVLRKLCEYEDLEEQGLLLRLPCKVGDVVYDIENYKVGVEWVDEGYDHLGRRGYYHNVYRQRIRKIRFKLEYLNKIGTSIFLTTEEAEAALAKIKGEIA